MFAFFHQSQCTEYESNNNVFLEYRSIYSRMSPPAIVSNRNYYASLAGASLPCAIWRCRDVPLILKRCTVHRGRTRQTWDMRPFATIKSRQK